MTTSNHAPKRLLLVEDNPLFAEQLTEAILHLQDSWEIQEFSEGRAAQAFLAQTDKPLDLVLVDLGLPDIPGADLIRSTRQRFPEVPIVVVSVVAAEGPVLGAIEAGANGYILKDESIEEITQGILKVLDGIYPLSPRLARYLFKQLTDTSAKATPSEQVRLSPRESQTLQFLSKGYSYEGVAEQMGVSLSTVQSNVRSLYRKLNVKSQSQAVLKAMDYKLL